jgi:hypothetical protein
MSRGGSSDAAAPVRFFTMADSENFIGLLALVGSLRLHGHNDPLTVLDLGFTADQRSVLEGLCDTVRVDGIAGRHPWFLASYPYRLHAEGIVVYIDSDVIVTSRLDHAFVAARRGMVCAASDPASRWFADWGPIFGLERPLRRQVYVSAAFVAFSTTQFPHLLRRWWECCDDLAQRLGSPPSDRTNPVALPDQDALNALLMSEVPAGSIELLPQNAAAQGPRELAQTSVVDLRRLECRHAGQQTMLLHAYGRPKPWQSNAWRNLRRTAYVRCLRRLLNRSDARVCLDDRTLPVWLRPDARGAVTLHLLFGISWIRRQVTGAGRRIKVRARSAAPLPTSSGR